MVRWKIAKLEFSGLRFALSLLFRNEIQHLCSVICKDQDLNKEFLRLQFYFEYQRDILEFFDLKIFEPLFMLSHIDSQEKHGLVILLSIAQLHVGSFS